MLHADDSHTTGNKHPYSNVSGTSKASCDDDCQPAELLALQSMQVEHKLGC